MDKQEVLDLIQDSGYGFLATTEENQPRVRPVAPYVSEDGRVLMAIMSHSRSLKQIEANPRVELCFVDRKMDFCRITGEAKINNDPQVRQLIWDNQPQLKQYAGGPDDQIFQTLEVSTTHIEAMTPNDRQPQIIKF